MGMCEKEFGDMDVPTFFLKLFYFNKFQEEKVRIIAELVRAQTFHLINIQLDKLHKFKSPAEMWAMEWDKEEKKRIEYTPEQFQEILNKANNILSGF